MIEELTTKMHKEFEITKDVEIRHRAGCVWNIVDYDAPKEKVTEAAKRYGITYDAAMKYRDYWCKNA